LPDLVGVHELAKNKKPKIARWRALFFEWYVSLSRGMIASLQPFFAECGRVPFASPPLLLDFDYRKGFFDLSESSFKLGDMGSQDRSEPPELADAGFRLDISMWSVCILSSIHRLGNI
jgi:hypothetical protein